MNWRDAWVTIPSGMIIGGCFGLGGDMNGSPAVLPLMVVGGVIAFWVTGYLIDKENLRKRRMGKLEGEQE